MLFVTVQDFEIPPFEIPDLTDNSSFPVYVDREIKLELERILGSALYDSFIPAYEGTLEDPAIPYPTRWQKIVDGDTYLHLNKKYKWKGMHEAFTHFIYSKWIGDTVNSQTNNGVVEPKNENSVSVSPARRMVTGHNMYCDLVGDNRNLPTNTLLGYLWNSGDTFLDLVVDEYVDIRTYLRARVTLQARKNVFNLRATRN